VRSWRLRLEARDCTGSRRKGWLRLMLSEGILLAAFETCKKRDDKNVQREGIWERKDEHERAGD